uniref:Uncharacterized protein n=1 Tax=Coccidioides posadasii RMSCC 3488 TaxID=454284 RepID=A0A0J6FQF9_COCPO|nr:hypothetical protein CPAG_08003 [Coccidioides posadasii RMSCC 3488]
MGGEEWMDGGGSQNEHTNRTKHKGGKWISPVHSTTKCSERGEKTKNACSGQVEAGLRWFKRYTLLLKKALFYELLTFTFEDFTLNKQRIQGEGGKTEENLRCKDANHVVEETEEDVGGEE